MKKIIAQAFGLISLACFLSLIASGIWFLFTGVGLFPTEGLFGRPDYLAKPFILLLLMFATGGFSAALYESLDE